MYVFMCVTRFRMDLRAFVPKKVDSFLTLELHLMVAVCSTDRY